MRYLALTWSRLRTASATALVLFLLLLSVGHGDHISDLRLAAGSFEQDIVRWQVSHFMDKWLNKAAGILPWSNDDELDAVVEFFALRDQIISARQTVNHELAAAGGATFSAQSAFLDLNALNKRRAQLQPSVEEKLESAITQAALEFDVIDKFGPVLWPPVDFTFEERALVLVRSPRDRIARLDDLLLDSDVSVFDQIALEDEIEALDGNTSALVVQVGGIATYPAQVSPDNSLRGTLELAAHEWLHHWMIFRPLGQRWFSGGELQAINETVANIFAQEVGDRAYEIMTGEKVNRPPWKPPIITPRGELPDDVFDYSREMRTTRSELEALLAEGRVEFAEAYLEARRQEFVANGHNIRKLNNAWFAFHGTYTNSAASVSPIEGQLRAIRADAGSLAEFLHRVAAIDAPGQLEQRALAAGWVPIDTSTGLPLEQAASAR